MVNAVVTAKATGPTAAIGIPLNPVEFGNGISLLLNFTGTATANVEVSNDPTAATNPSAASWNVHDVLTVLSVNTNSTLIVPVSAIRLNVTAYTSGSVKLGVCGLNPL